jgi:hypothetical protein
MSTATDSFVYCWTDNKTNKIYVGYHKGNINDGYICSSKTMLAEYYSRPEDFSRQIIANCSHEEAVSLEAAILRSAQAHKSDDFYNLALSNGIAVITPETRKIMSEAAKKRPSNRKGTFHSNKSKELISKNNASSKPIKTPYGNFPSRAAYARHMGVTQQTVKEFFKRLDKPLDGRGGKKLYEKEHIGKTPREIGYE